MDVTVVEPRPTTSPLPDDNEKIAFSSQRDRPGFAQIYVMNADDGSEQRRLTNGPASNGHPDWSPDGTKIAFMSDRDGDTFDIYVMNADGTNPTRLTDDPAHDEAPDWGPATQH